MQKTLFFILAIGLAIYVIPQNSIAQDIQDWHLWGLPEGAKARFGRGTITGGFASSHDGKRLAVPCSIGIWIYDTETDKALNLLIGHSSDVLSERRVQDTKELWILTEHTGGVLSVAFSPDDTLLASTNYDKTVSVWDARTGTELWTMQGHKDKPTDVAFSPDGKMLASASEDNTIRVWDAQTGKHLHTFEGHTGSVTSVAFSPDGSLLASGGEDKTVQLWDVQTGQSLHTFIAHRDKVLDIAFSPDGKLLASGSEDNTVRLWDVETRESFRTLTDPYENDVLSVALSADGKRLAAGDVEGSVYVLDAVSGITQQRFTGHEGEVKIVAFASDGKVVVSLSDKGVILLWDVK